MTRIHATGTTNSLMVGPVGGPRTDYPVSIVGAPEGIPEYVALTARVTVNGTDHEFRVGRAETYDGAIRPRRVDDIVAAGGLPELATAIGLDTAADGVLDDLALALLDTLPETWPTDADAGARAQASRNQGDTAMTAIFHATTDRRRSGSARPKVVKYDVNSLDDVHSSRRSEMFETYEAARAHAEKRAAEINEMEARHFAEAQARPDDQADDMSGIINRVQAAADRLLPHTTGNEALMALWSRANEFANPEAGVQYTDWINDPDAGERIIRDIDNALDDIDA